MRSAAILLAMCTSAAACALPGSDDAGAPLDVDTPSTDPGDVSEPAAESANLSMTGVVDPTEFGSSSTGAASYGETWGQSSGTSSGGASSTTGDVLDETWGTTWDTTGGSGGEWLPGDPRPGGYLEPNAGERAAKNCSGPNSWRSIDPEEPKVFIAGVYEAVADDGSLGAVTVRWSIPGDNVLVVAGYHAVDWTITLVGDGNLAEVIAAGRDVQTIDAPPGVITEEFLSDDGIAGDALLENGLDLLEFAEGATGLTVYGFDGCYETHIFAFNE